MAVDDIVSLRVVGRYQSQNVVNTLHYRVVSQSSSEQELLDNLAEGWLTELETPWLARHLDTYTLIGTKAFNDTGDAKVPGFNASGQGGVVVGEELPSYVCRTITLFTDSDNYRRRGRIMLSSTAVAQLETTDGAVTDAEVTLLTALGNTLMAVLDITTDTFQLCIPPVGELPYEDVTAVRGRKTPSSVTTRRIRQYLIG